MADQDYRLRFQLQGSSQNIASKEYHDYNTPCSKSSAKQKLGEVESEASRFYSDSDWRGKLSSAIEKAKNWVDRASGMDRQGGRATVYNDSFDYDGKRFRVEIEIWSGSGHFSR